MTIKNTNVWDRLPATMIAVLPLAGITLLCAGYSLFFYLQFDSFVDPLVFWNVAAIVMLVGGGLCLLAHLMACALGSRRTRSDAVTSLLTSIVCIILCVMIIERYLPAKNTLPERRDQLDHYSEIQAHLQSQLLNRLQTISYTFRGAELQESTNSFGWPGVDRSHDSPKSRIVFIGDSFLETRSSRNLAQLFEDRLTADGKNIEVINLSHSDTGLDDYQFRLHELALSYDPELIVIFLYAANDILLNHQFIPYSHGAYRVTDDALHFLKINMPDKAPMLDELINQRNEDSIFHDKESFINVMDGLELSDEEKTFAYLVTYAFSSIQYPYYPIANVAPTLLTRLTQIWKKLLPKDDMSSGWMAYQPRYDAIFKLPPSERLNHIARLAARMNNSNNVELFRDSLNRLPEKFKAELIAETDMTYFLWPAISEYVLDKPTGAKAGKAALDRIAYEYEKSIKAMQEFSESQGTKLAFVIIPEASYVDDEFFSFWEPLLNFRTIKSNEHSIIQTLDYRLSRDVSIINLMHSDRMNGTYWYFDGHWNDLGNTIVADILTQELHKRELLGKDAKATLQ